MALIRLVLFWIIRAAASLRYKVTIEGREHLKKGARGVIVFPNHPGFMDPPLIILHTWRWLELRPLVDARFYKPWYLNWIMRLVRAVPLKRLEERSASAHEGQYTTVQTVVDGLKQGHNHYLAPAGRTQRRGIEIIGSNRGAAQILKDAPDATALMVLARGLWGSSFTFAPTGKEPSLFGAMLKGVLWCWANFTFFMPRRRVTITIEPVDRSQLGDYDRTTVNRYLEAFLNGGDTEDGVEKPTYVPYHFLFGARDYEYPPQVEEVTVDLTLVKPETKQAVKAMLTERDVAPDDAERADARLDDIGLDSIDRLDLSLAIEDHFHFPANRIPITVGDLWALAQGLAEGTSTEPPPPIWFKTRKSDSRPAKILGTTIPHAFASIALERGKACAAADDIAGAITYERMLIGARALAGQLRKLPGQYLGLMLPASVGADVALFAIQFAGKIPVLMNWTTGAANMAHAVKSLGFTHVVTSQRFIDRINVQIDGAEYVMLEDVRGRIKKPTLLKLLVQTKLFPFTIHAALPHPKPDDPAVVLFTSGSEKAPKAVPLSHKNILSNIQAIYDLAPLTRADSVVSFLPMFHSFGLTITALLPLLGGGRAVHHPDPTDATPIARKCGLYKPTLLAGTPTFLNYILERAKPGEMHSVRLAVTGAERCPQHVFDLMKQHASNAVIVEGYGITECSPVVSANPPEAPRLGTIGIPLPGVEIRIVDPDSHAPVADGERGMLLAHGPSIFDGYLNYDGPSPFLELDGKRWYVTGDLGVRDADGYITFKGRLKRFLKIAGEMVSLPALEEPFTDQYPGTEDGPRVAVEGIEVRDEPDGSHSPHKLVLFHTPDVSITLHDANAMLAKAGIKGVMKLTDVKQVDAIPVLGTGKTDYKVLRTKLEEAPVGEPVSASADR